MGPMGPPPPPGGGGLARVARLAWQARYRLFRSLLVRSHGGLIEDRT